MVHSKRPFTVLWRAQRNREMQISSPSGYDTNWLRVSHWPPRSGQSTALNLRLGFACIKYSAWGTFTEHSKDKHGETSACSFNYSKAVMLAKSKCFFPFTFSQPLLGFNYRVRKWLNSHITNNRSVRLQNIFVSSRWCANTVSKKKKHACYGLVMTWPGKMQV